MRLRDGASGGDRAHEDMPAEEGAIVKARSLAAWKALTSIVGPDEAQLWTGLTLVTVALWPLAAKWLGTGLPALLVPGAIVIWSALPSRAAFIVHPSASEKPTRRTS